MDNCIEVYIDRWIEIQAIDEQRQRDRETEGQRDRKKIMRERYKYVKGSVKDRQNYGHNCLPKRGKR